MNALPPTSRRALEIFEAALDCDEAERAAYVESACAGDADMQRRVEALLRAHARSTGFLEPPPAAAPPKSIGPYHLLHELGSGGMGSVFLAERSDGAFEQRVAIKLLAGRWHDAQARRRAESERRFLARLEHPNVARILDGGNTPEGQPYVVMEYVDGVTIERYVAEHKLGLRARVELFLQVLAAVDSAHRALIIHRDLKPGNVLVTCDGQVKLLDFGIAKSLDASFDAAATHTGHVALTPQYASPEQLAGKPLTTACDVYALGLLLHELLTGQPAHRIEGRSLYELERWLAAHPPSRPSTRIDAAALELSNRRAADWRRRIDGDLDRVVMKALAAEPERRYATAHAFAEDLQRWLEHQPVLAREGGFFYRAGKFVRRNRVAVAAAAIACVAIVAGTAVALQQGWRAAREAERAHRANAFLTSIIDFSNPRVSGKAVLLVDALDHAAAGIPARVAGDRELEGDIRHALGEAYLGLDRTDAAGEQLARAAELRASAGGNDYAMTLDLQAMLAWRLGNMEQAEALLREALEQCTRDVAGRRQRAAVLGDFAGFLGDMGRFEEALPLAEESASLNDRLPGVPAENRAASLNNLATSYYGLGRYDDARAAFARAGALFETVQPRPELELSINYNNQSVLLARLGRTAEAIPLAEQSVALKRGVMGDDYVQLVRPLSHLAHYYAEVGRQEDAARAIAEALRLAPRLYPNGGNDIGGLQLEAARLALGRGDRRAAADAAREALAAFAQDPKPDAKGRSEAEAILAGEVVPTP